MNPVTNELCERAEYWVWVYRPNDRPGRYWDKVGRAPIDRGTPVQWQFAAARTERRALTAQAKALTRAGVLE